MAVTLVEGAIENGQQSTLEIATVKMFTQLSPILARLPMDKIDGSAYYYNREAALPGIGWRGVNQAWAESTGLINPYVERLYILGGEVKIDNFILRTQPAGAQDVKARQYKMKVQALSNEFDRAFFEGDDLTDVNQMIGLRRRLSGNQVLLQATGGGTLTLAAVDQLIDAVPFDDKVLFMNRTVRRKMTALVNATGGSARIDYTLDNVGRQIARYNGAEIAIIEQSGDGSTYLDYDEDPGDGTSDTASIYCVSFGEDRLHGIWNGDNGKIVSVDDFGEMQSEPRVLGRVEAYYGLAILHPRAAARLRGITNT